jgi:hypothetical protein
MVYYQDDKITPPASGVRESSSLMHNGKLASNTTTFWVTFTVSVSVVRSRNKPSSFRLYLQQLSWVIMIIPLSLRYPHRLNENGFTIQIINTATLSTLGVISDKFKVLKIYNSINFAQPYTVRSILLLLS